MVVELAFLVVSFAVPCTREGVMHGAPDGAALGNGCALMGLKNCFSLKIVGLVVVELAFLVVSFAVPCTREGVMHGAPDGAALGNGCALMGLKNCFSLKIVFH